MKAHEPGLSHTPWTVGIPLSLTTTYLHGNLIGSTEASTRRLQEDIYSSYF